MRPARSVGVRRAARPVHRSTVTADGAETSHDRQGGLTVKRIEVVAKAFKLDDIRDVLKGAGINGMTIAEVRGLLPQGDVQTYRGVQYLVDYSPRIKVEVVVSDAQLFAVLRVLEDAARTGRLGDATIMVSPLDDVIQVRTGERGGCTIDRGSLRTNRAA